MDDAELAAAARDLIDANRYLTLASADAEGDPWASPVWFAHAGYREFFWISRPGARHSRNIAARPRVAIAIFDSTVPVGGAAAVYVEAGAEEVSESDPGRSRAIEVYAQRSAADGGIALGDSYVRPPAEHRLYRAIATAHYLLGEGDQRVEIGL